ncbi:SRPBCC family protein [Nocardia jiangxiensis]|uniref:SRPBCC family protein n=1 Tax=Nocardia jiangxiensis TaxID=282685 RepID=UPI000594CB10|nr:SRPBCC family protein [Nocardia jiangxiensis]
MVTFRSHLQFDHPAEAVWNLIADAGNVSSWFPLVKSSQAEGPRRHLTLQDGTPVVEDIITIDSVRRRFQYSISGGGIPVQSHLSTVDVIEVSDGSTLVVYSVEIEPAVLLDVLGPAVEEAVRNLPTALSK